MQQGIQLWLRDNSYGEVTRMEPLSGGCINSSSRLHFDQSASLVLKQNDQAKAGMFSAEAMGLRALASAQALRVPAVIHCEDAFILLEDLGHGQAQAPYWQDLGTGLATLHRDRKHQFGFNIDNYCGATPQLNSLEVDGFAFFANYRLLHLASQAYDR
jgi:protein-ribulosamine 3-kinase